MSTFPEQVTHREKLFIGGDWVTPQANATIDLFAPHTGKIYGQVPSASVEDVDAAVGAAKEAFESGPWSQMNRSERADVMDRFADEIEKRADLLANICTQQNGSLLTMNQQVNVPWAVNCVRYYANMVRQASDEQSRECFMADATIRQVPVGVAGIIVPWNVPLIAAVSKWAPAMAAGCTVVHKPSPETPLDAYIIAEAAIAADLPAGVYNLVPAHREASERLVTHPNVNHIAFTGSTPVGKHIASLCARDMKRYFMELGGNAAAVIMPDAPMEVVIPGVIGTSLLLNNGEACIAQTRVLLPKAQYDQYVAAFAGAVDQLVVGSPFEPATHLGPMVSEGHLQRVQEYIKIGQEEDGARLVAGGPEKIGEGWFVKPTVFADVRNDMRICQEEIFGPVIKLVPYESEEEAIALANSTDFGLSGSVWGGDTPKAAALGRQIQAGSLFINGAFTVDVNVPFGGFKQSGVGRECGPEGLEEYLEQQVIFTPKANA